MTNGTLSTDRDQLTVQDVAHQLGVDPATVNGWLTSGELAGYRLPTRWLIMVDDLAAFLAKNRSGAQDPAARGGRQDQDAPGCPQAPGARRGRPSGN